MEFGDPFVPTFAADDNGHVDLPEQWMSPFSASNGNGDSAVAIETAPAPAAVDDTPRPAASIPHSAGDGLDRAKQFAGQVATALEDLQHALEGGERERAELLEERARMHEQIRQLQTQAEYKRRFVETLTSGTGATISNDDLQAMQGITDALTQDPDRLTVLFNVVQQASKLSAIVTVFNQLRTMSEEMH